MTNELPPYSYNEVDLPDIVKPHLIRTDSFTFQGQHYDFGVINREAAPFANFVGMPDGNNLFASEDVVESEHLKFASLGHEVLCNRTYANMKGESRCPLSEQDILEMLPKEVVVEVLKSRLEMFTGLVSTYGIDPDNPKGEFQTQLIATKLFVEKSLKKF